MAELVKVVHEGEGFECQMCGVPWVPKDIRKPPRRCPNHKCRSVRWDARKYPHAGPPNPPAPNGGGGDEPPTNGNGNGNGGLQRTCYQTLPPAARKPAVPVTEQSPRVADAA